MSQAEETPMPANFVATRPGVFAALMGLDPLTSQLGQLPTDVNNFLKDSVPTRTGLPNQSPIKSGDRICPWPGCGAYYSGKRIYEHIRKKHGKKPPPPVISSSRIVNKAN